MSAEQIHRDVVDCEDCAAFVYENTGVRPRVDPRLGIPEAMPADGGYVVAATRCDCESPERPAHKDGSGYYCSGARAAKARALDIALRALRQIANEDYRGNRSSAAVTADRALLEIDGTSL